MKKVFQSRVNWTIVWVVLVLATGSTWAQITGLSGNLPGPAIAPAAQPANGTLSPGPGLQMGAPTHIQAAPGGNSSTLHPTGPGLNQSLQQPTLAAACNRTLDPWACSGPTIGQFSAIPTSLTAGNPVSFQLRLSNWQRAKLYLFNPQNRRLVKKIWEKSVRNGAGNRVVDIFPRPTHKPGSSTTYRLLVTNPHNQARPLTRDITVRVMPAQLVQTQQLQPRLNGPGLRIPSGHRRLPLGNKPRSLAQLSRPGGLSIKSPTGQVVLQPKVGSRALSQNINHNTSQIKRGIATFGSAVLVPGPVVKLMVSPGTISRRSQVRLHVTARYADTVVVRWYTEQNGRIKVPVLRTFKLLNGKPLNQSFSVWVNPKTDDYGTNNTGKFRHTQFEAYATSSKSGKTVYSATEVLLRDVLLGADNARTAGAQLKKSLQFGTKVNLLTAPEITYLNIQKGEFIAGDVVRIKFGVRGVTQVTLERRDDNQGTWHVVPVPNMRLPLSIRLGEAHEFEVNDKLGSRSAYYRLRASREGMLTPLVKRGMAKIADLDVKWEQGVADCSYRFGDLLSRTFYVTGYDQYRVLVNGKPYTRWQSVYKGVSRPTRVKVDPQFITIAPYAIQKTFFHYAIGVRNSASGEFNEFSQYCRVEPPSSVDVKIVMTINTLHVDPRRHPMTLLFSCLPVGGASLAGGNNAFTVKVPTPWNKTITRTKRLVRIPNTSKSWTDSGIICSFDGGDFNHGIAIRTGSVTGHNILGMSKKMADSNIAKQRWPKAKLFDAMFKKGWQKLPYSQRLILTTNEGGLTLRP